MSPAYEIQVVFLQEFRDLVGSEGIGNAPVIFAPSLDVSVRIGPQEVAEEALVRHIGGPLHGPNLVQALQLRGEAAVHAQDLVVNDCSDRQTVEAVGEYLPQSNAESTLALVVESVDSVDGGALVVSAEEEQVVWEFDLVRKEKAYRLYALLPPVDVVSEEQIVGVRRRPTTLEQP